MPAPTHSGVRWEGLPRAPQCSRLWTTSGLLLRAPQHGIHDLAPLDGTRGSPRQLAPRDAAGRQAEPARLFPGPLCVPSARDFAPLARAWRQALVHIPLFPSAGDCLRGDPGDTQGLFSVSTFCGIGRPTRRRRRSPCARSQHSAQRAPNLQRWALRLQPPSGVPAAHSCQGFISGLVRGA